jgi:hypothetical protein
MSDFEEYVQEYYETQEYEANTPLLCKYVDFFLRNNIIARKEEDVRSALFRGQSDSSFRLEPSIFRKGLLLKEHILIHELLIKAPDAFSPFDNAFQKLIKMQHYGLPTRLLDFTTNPLVALFFACNGSFDKDGEVIILYDYLERSDSKEVLDIAILAEFPGSKRGDLRCYLSEHGGRSFTSSSKSGISHELDAFLQRTYIPVSAPLNNERIKRQHGAFIIVNIGSPNRSNLYQKEAFDLKPLIVRDFGDGLERKIIVPKNEKKELLIELDALGINNSSFLFPEFEHQASYLRQKYEEE